VTEEQIALARRAVACKGWRWMPGMADHFGRRVMQVYPDELGFRWSHLLKNCVVRDADALPDLTDPATLGCLLALVREAWGDPSLYVRRGSTTRKSDGVRAWEVLGWLDPSRSPDGRGGSWSGWGYASEAEALVAALEAAPNTGGEHRREEGK